MPLLKPPVYEDVPVKSPLMFLIGPIQGAPDWQNPTSQWFLRRMPEVYVASPRSEMWKPDLSEEEHKRLFEQQAHWEHMYIQEALLRMVSRSHADGLIVAWCPKEEAHDPKRAYGQTTRFELGTILGWIDGRKGRNPFNDPCADHWPDGPIFIGADPEFTGRRYLEYTMAAQGRVLFSSLEATRDEALRYLRRTV